MDRPSVLPKISSAMDHLDWIRKGLERPGKTQTGLARALGRSPSAVTHLLQGKRALKQREVPAVAQYLGVSPPETAFLPEQDPDRVVRVAGYVGAGAEAHYYAVAQGDLDEVAPPNRVTERTVAVEVRGDSLGALFDRGLVFYDDVRSPVTPDLIGKLCVVGLPDDRVLVKKIRRGKNGLYDLVSNSDADTLRGVAIDWAAAVKIIVPR
jgi:transcriptional regulator with XRE-family HTH domain